ncbi:MAG: hypothetical protein ACRDV6_10365 [Acidimicrobiales bacterium]
MHAAATISTGLGSTESLVAAEAPDGAVFFACSSSDCTSSASAQAASVVQVVERTGAPVVAEHVSGLVQAIAASSTDLFVATNTSITEYNRTNGQVVCHWSDPTNVTPSGNFYPAVDLAFGDGLLWAVYGIGTDQSGYEPSILERIVPGSSGQPQVVSSDVGQNGVVVGASGAFFGDFMDTTIHAVASDGSAAGSSGTLPKYPILTSLQAEVQGAVIGLGLDATGTQSSIVTYSATNLAQAVTTAPLSLMASQGPSIQSTLAGPLLAVGGCNNAALGFADADVQVSSRCSGLGTLERVAVNDGSTSDAVAVPGARALLGPYPVVIATSGGTTVLVRLS